MLTTVEISLASNALRKVDCERCQTQYFYVLTRSGDGNATGLQAIDLFSSGTKNRAARAAAENLEDRLSNEAELVPCPKCHWINESLVTGYRDSYLQHWDTNLYAIAGLGMFSLFFVVFLSFLKEEVVLLGVGKVSLISLTPYPAVVFLIAVVAWIWRIQLRKGIDPNVNFPAKPTLPRGTPPALLLDKTQDKLQVVSEQYSTQGQGNGESSEHVVMFQYGLHQIPPVCEVCLAKGEKLHYYPRAILAQINFDVPFCESCKRKKFLSGWALAAMFIAAGVTCGLLLWPKKYPMIMLLIISLVGACFFMLTVAIIKSIKDRILKQSTYARWHDKSRNLLKVYFVNADYANLVRQFNKLETKD